MFRILFSATILILCLQHEPAHGEGLLRKHNARPLQAESDLSVLESWETPIAGFFIRSHHEVPTIDREKWELEIDGLVENPLKISLSDLEEHPQQSLHAVLECSGNGRGLQEPSVPGVQWRYGAVGNAEWTGIQLSQLLQKAGVKPQAKFVRVEGADKPALESVPPFIRSIPLSKMMEKDTLIALKMNREPLPILHGGPLRLILPNWYGQNWIKWLKKLTLTEAEDPSFYMKKGYRMPKEKVLPGKPWDSATGTPIQELKVQSIIVSPTEGQPLLKGNVNVSGKAFSGTGAIAKVEISTDNGKHWKTATLEAPHPDGGWQEFSYAFEATKPGPLTILSKATDTQKTTQPMTHTWNPSGYLRNSVMRVQVNIVNNPSAVASQLYQEKCLVCHTAGIVEGQHLKKDGWEKVVKKMENFGVQLTAEERTLLVGYLSSQAAFGTKPPQPTEFGTETTLFSPDERNLGDPAKGKELYQSHCLACHGNEAEGKTGPRLKGRAIPSGSFWYTVINGMRTMPAYGQTLSRQQIADIRRYLQN